MTCQDVRERLSAWRDGDAAGSAGLSVDERKAVAQHLDQCADCRDALAALERTALGVRRLPGISAPRSVMVRAMALGHTHAADMTSEPTERPPEPMELTARISFGVEAVREMPGASPPLRASAPAAVEQPAAAKRSRLPKVALVLIAAAVLAVIAYALGFRF